MDNVDTSERHYDLVVRPRGGAASRGRPPCDCEGAEAAEAGPPPPRFLLPPPPVNPAWATHNASAADCDVAPYRVCRVVPNLPPEAGLQGESSPSPSILAALITTSLFLFIALVAGAVFFCKYRRRLLPARKPARPDEADRILYDDLLTMQPRVIPSAYRSGAPHIELAPVKGQHYPRLLPRGVPNGVPSGVPPGGAVFLYPAPPSLAGTGSERTSNMYEEIPYYAPSVSGGTESDDDVTTTTDDVISRPSDAELLQPLVFIPLAAHARELPPDVTYVRTLPSVQNVPYASSPRALPPGNRTYTDKRRRPPFKNNVRVPRKKDPYYYSDILPQDDDASDNIRCDNRDAAPVGSFHPVHAGIPVSVPADDTPHYGRMVDPQSLHGHAMRQRAGSGRTTPLASRMAPGPFVDIYSGQRHGDWDRSRMPAVSSFRSRGRDRSGDAGSEPSRAGVDDCPGVNGELRSSQQRYSHSDGGGVETDALVGAGERHL